MATPYREVYGRFLSKIVDFDLPQLTPQEMEDYCYDIMFSALPKIQKIENDLSVRDDILAQFDVDLIDVEIEVISCQMVCEWVDRRTNTTQNINMFASTKDENMKSQAAHITALINLRKEQRAIVSTLIRDYGYQKMLGGE